MKYRDFLEKGVFYSWITEFNELIYGSALKQISTGNK